MNDQKHPVLKSPASSAEDVAYTINHAIACTVTDFIDPFVGKWTQDYLGKKISIGCGHDHSHDDSHHHHHNHEHHHHAKLSHWWAGELAGDFGAVPVTVAVQYYAPSLMAGIRCVMEPVLGGFFHNGARQSAKRWAENHGVAVDSDAAKEYEKQLYRYEIEHLPQALAWTVSSVAINISTQRMMGSHAPISHMLAGKAAGASISAALVVGARGVAPAAARDWDGFTSRHLFTPATKITGALFGINEKDVDEMKAKEESIKDGAWAKRVKSGDDSVISPSP